MADNKAPSNKPGEFVGQKHNAPGKPGEARLVVLTVTGSSEKMRRGDNIQLQVRNETGFDITNEATYRLKDPIAQRVTVTQHGLIESVAVENEGKLGGFDIEIEDAAGGWGSFHGEVVAGGQDTAPGVRGAGFAPDFAKGTTGPSTGPVSTQGGTPSQPKP